MCAAAPLHQGSYPEVACHLLQVIVASKFDNRLKEFAERWEVDKYLSASGYLAPNVRPFFVALPKVSALKGADAMTQVQ